MILTHCAVLRYQYHVNKEQRGELVRDSVTAKVKMLVTPNHPSLHFTPTPLSLFVYPI